MRFGLKKLATLLLLAGAGLSAVACADDSDAGDDGAPSISTDAPTTSAPSTTSTPSTTSLAPGSTVTATTTEALTTTVAPTTSTTVSAADSPSTTISADGGVTAHATMQTYAVGDTVEIVVTNDLADVIVVQDQRGLCTIIFIDGFVDDAWGNAAPCLSGPPPVSVSLAAGSTTTIALPQPLPPGTYRGRLVYSVGSEGGPGDTEFVTPTFVVE